VKLTGSDRTEHLIPAANVVAKVAVSAAAVEAAVAVVVVVVVVVVVWTAVKKLVMGEITTD
jgi:hypothetical protein